MAKIRARIIARTLVYNIARFEEMLGQNEGRWVTIEVDEPERSSSQLRMYRAWLDNTANHTGNDPEELHQFLLDKCAPRMVVTITGKSGTKHEVEQIKRTSAGHSLSMNKEEMGTYMERCVVLTGYPLPTQEELLAMGYLPH
jgi:hypothetical protein